MSPLRGGVWSLACLVVTAVIVVAVPRPQGVTPEIVDYHGDLMKFARIAPYVVAAPEGLPASWQPVSSRLTVGGADGAGTVTWHLGYMTPSGMIASLEESNANPAEFIRRMTNSGKQQQPVRLAGMVWSQRWRSDKDQRSIYYPNAPGHARAPGVTVVLTGNAGWPELYVLAASLRPQPR
jgi:hypothetical protein